MSSAITSSGAGPGIKAEVFSLGFGPKLLSRVDKHGTRWQIAAIPLGGYVKFLGDANAASAGADEEEMAALSEDERRHTMHGAPLWARAATVVAGPVFNFILSIAIITGLMMWTGMATDTPVIGGLVELPGGTHDLREGDEVVAVAGQEITDYATFGEAIEAMPGGETLPWRVRRDGVEIEILGPQPYPPRVAGVAMQSAAQAAGLVPGDVIAGADGTEFHRFADLQAAVKAAEGAPLTLDVWRPGADGGSAQTLNVTLTPKVTDLPLPDGGFETDC